MSRILGPVFAVALKNLRSVPSRLGAAFMVVIAIAGSVAVTLSVTAMYKGLANAIEKAGRDDRLIIVSRGARFEGDSMIPRASVLVIEDLLKQQSARSRPVAIASEVLILVPLTRKRDSLDVFGTLRGATPEVWDVRREMRIVEGRKYQPGLHELVVGRTAAEQFEGLQVGKRLLLPQGEWEIVGIYESDGDAHESELLADGQTVLAAYGRDAYASVSALMPSESSYADIRQAFQGNPLVSVDVLRESDYYAALSARITSFLRFLAYFVGTIMAVGATSGAINGMYAAISARSREIAMFRAIGFRSSVIVGSIWIELLVLILAGVCVGLWLVWALFDGTIISTTGATERAQFSYGLNLDWRLCLVGLAYGCVIGLVGGLLPARRAARISIARAIAS